MSLTSQQPRSALIDRLFPAGVPGLWCPPLTHYDATGSLDLARMTAHAAFMASWVRGLLIPGSTGDAWELSAKESAAVLDAGLDLARQHRQHLLVGSLRTEPGQARAAIEQSLVWLRQRTGRPDPVDAMEASNVRGFVVCGPRGESRTQENLAAELASVLDLGVPTAVYQLPQITHNVIAPATLADLARRYENLIFFKDSGGVDEVAQSGLLPAGVFRVRGAEGDYARWLASNGGPYHGLLLSTANCFPNQLDQILAGPALGLREQAAELSTRLTRLVSEVFNLVTPLPDGNAFANANKAMDHFNAFGSAAAGKTPPRLHTGSRLPVEVIHKTGQLLLRHGFMPEKGYLE